MQKVLFLSSLCNFSFLSCPLWGVRLRLRIMVSFRLYKPSSPIVRELALSLTWLSYTFVRFKYNPFTRLRRSSIFMVLKVHA